MYRRAVSTFQGVKSDGIFSFQPPINILALIFLWPARIFVTPHTYHKIIVFAARFTNLPLLLIIRLVERHFLFRGQVYGSNGDGGDRDGDSGKPKWWRPSIWAWKLDWFGGTRTELNAVFEYESDIDDDALPGGAFDIHDGVMTPANVESDTGDTTAAAAKIMQLGDGISSSSTSLNGNGRGGGGGRANSRGRESMRRKSSKQDHHQQLAHQQGGEMDIQALRERSRQRRTQSMSDWGGTIASTSSNMRVRPTILSKLYGYGSSRMNVNHQYNPIPNTTTTLQEGGGIPSGITTGGGSSAGDRKRELNDEDTIRTPNTAGSRISWPLSGTGSSSRFAVVGPGFNEEEQEEEDDEEEEDEEERRNIRDRLDRIEEGQKRIEEALKALGGGGD